LRRKLKSTYEYYRNKITGRQRIEKEWLHSIPWTDEKISVKRNIQKLNRGWNRLKRGWQSLNWK